MNIQMVGIGLMRVWKYQIHTKKKITRLCTYLPFLLQYNCKFIIINVDAEKQPQQLNLFPLGNNSVNPSSNVSLIATFYICQPENTVRIRQWGSSVDPPILKSEIAYEERKIRRTNCE